MNILLNATSSVIGGGIQKTSAFLAEIQRDPREHQWCLAASRAVAEQMKNLGLADLQHMHIFESRPSKDNKVRSQIKDLTKAFHADSVFTIAGPSYIQFDAPHLLAFTDPWVTHSTWLAYRQRRFPTAWGNVLLNSLYKGYWTRKADAWTTQTETAKAGLHRRLQIPRDRVAIVANTCADRYRENTTEARFPEPGKKIRLLVFGAFYPHKRLHAAIHVAKELKKREKHLRFEFVLTVPHQHPGLQNLFQLADTMGVREHIVNIGPVPLVDGPKLYKSCDICFMPTVLETFSATYPEAMAMGLPIVTSNLGFLRDVCGAAALYFSPQCLSAAADPILELLGNRSLWEDLVAKGIRQLTRFPTPSVQYHALVDVLEQLAAGTSISENPCDMHESL